MRNQEIHILNISWLIIIYFSKVKKINKFCNMIALRCDKDFETSNVGSLFVSVFELIDKWTKKYIKNLMLDNLCYSISILYMRVDWKSIQIFPLELTAPKLCNNVRNSHFYCTVNVWRWSEVINITKIKKI